MTRYNDWSFIEVVPSRKGFIEEDTLYQLEVTMRGVGRRMDSQVHSGRYGAYTVDYYCYEYYFVK